MDRQPGRQVRPQAGRDIRAALGDYTAEGLQLPASAWPRGDCRLGHVGMAAQHRFDADWLDAMAADLELLIDPSEDLDGAIGASPGAVAGAVNPGDGGLSMRVRD